MTERQPGVSCSIPRQRRKVQLLRTLKNIYIYTHTIYRLHFIDLTLHHKSTYICLQDSTELRDNTFLDPVLTCIFLMSVRQLKFGLKFCGVLHVYITTATREDHLKLKRRITWHDTPPKFNIAPEKLPSQ